MIAILILDVFVITGIAFFHIHKRAKAEQAAMLYKSKYELLKHYYDTEEDQENFELNEVFKEGEEK